VGSRWFLHVFFAGRDTDGIDGGRTDLVSFVTRFDRETVLVGCPKAHLWVEAEGADDMDLFLLIQKLDAHGTPLRQFTVPNQGAMIRDVTERGASILRYKGSDGRLRVSMRHPTRTCRPRTSPPTPSTASKTLTR